METPKIHRIYYWKSVVKLSQNGIRVKMKLSIEHRFAEPIYVHIYYIFTWSKTSEFGPRRKLWLNEEQLKELQNFLCRCILVPICIKNDLMIKWTPLNSTYKISTRLSTFREANYPCFSLFLLTIYLLCSNPILRMGYIRLWCGLLL